jgi:hypothetical protein
LRANCYRSINMSRRVRIILGLLILALSISLLIWGFLPARRETRVQPIPPAELQLPTPITLQYQQVFFL